MRGFFYCLMVWCSWLTGIGQALTKDNIIIAVASNFKPSLEYLLENHPNRHKIKIASAASGQLYAQIIKGAPFDVFLSADVKHPDLLIKQGYGVKESRFIYAKGRLKLVGNHMGRVKTIDDFRQSLQKIEYFSIANPLIAPYGMAAKDFLTQHDLWGLVQPKLVQGGNIAWSYQHIIMGNAQAGLVAASLLTHKPPSGHEISPLEIAPLNITNDINQAAIILTSANHKKLAWDFWHYLASPKARSIMAKYGYQHG